MNSLVCGIVILFVVTVTTCSAEDSQSLRKDVQVRSKRAMTADQLSAKTVDKINEIVDSVKAIGVTTEFLRKLISNLLELLHMVVKGAIMFVKYYAPIDGKNILHVISEVLPFAETVIGQLNSTINNFLEL